tara:strand:- start:270 stop:689 length:420 start_codon:yes stop_codon:yes gene_type:complete
MGVSKWIIVSGSVMLLIIAVTAVLWLWANARYRNIMAEAEAAWADISDRSTAVPDIYSPQMVSDLPDIAQRYFNHAIALRPQSRSPQKTIFVLEAHKTAPPYFLINRPPFPAQRTFCKRIPKLEIVHRGCTRGVQQMYA